MSAPTKLSYRSEVIGSLLRPEYLKEAVRRFEAGEISAAELEAAQDRAVLEAIALQESVGLDVITDGEMRRQYWFDPLTASLAGYDPKAPAPAIFTSGQAPAQQLPTLPAVTARLSLQRNLPLRELTFLRQHTSRPVKATLPSLSYASVLYVPGVSDRAYPDRDEYMQDAVRLTRQLVQQLVDSGVNYIQLDAPRYTHLVSETGIENFRRLGLNPETWLADMIALDNALMADFPNVTFGLHLCRGNHRSMWSVEGGYDAIAEQLFTTIKAERLLLEYDTPRAGTFAPLRFVPQDKVVVLGLITTKEPELESAELLQRRVEEASQYIPLERLALSPQCGFASTLPGNLITPEAQRAKLERLVEVAHAIWG
ncbi:MAG TPA: methionine synthase [Chloroflexota bacterium]|jgi:5-methyltetrahydropteroyltriglutamate--homocysteine methyltransferase|nr:methionine synthase [Chloroflexota bacterium]